MKTSKNKFFKLLGKAVRPVVQPKSGNPALLLCFLLTACATTKPSQYNATAPVPAQQSPLQRMSQSIEHALEWIPWLANEQWADAGLVRLRANGEIDLFYGDNRVNDSVPTQVSAK